MGLFAINKQTCTKDGICASVCPSGIIEMTNNGYPAAADKAEDLCIRCGHCVAVCPTASFSHRDMNAEKFGSIKEDLFISPAQCEQLLKSRRSIRAFEDKPVSKNILQNILDTARYAPTGHNSQSVQWLVLSDRNELQRLAGITVDWMRSDKDKMPDNELSFHMEQTIHCWAKGLDHVFRNAPAVIIAYGLQGDILAPESSIIALTYLELAAASMGLGCCWAGYFNAAAASFPPMIEALPLPRDHRCLGAMMIGYPKYKYRKIPARKQPDITWHL